jgi:hypothetical protein
MAEKAVGVGSTASGLLSLGVEVAKNAVAGEFKDYASSKYGRTGEAASNLVLNALSGNNSLGSDFAAFAGAAAAPAIDKMLGKLKNKKGFKFLNRLLGTEDKKVGDLEKMVARADPQMLFEFDVVLPAIKWPGYVSAGALPSEYVEDLDIPQETVEAGDEVTINARSIPLAGGINVTEFTLQFYGEHQHKVLKYLEAWRQCVRTPRGIYNLPYGKNGTGYFKTISAILRAGETPLIQFDMMGCFPTGRESIRLQSASSERLIISQTFTCAAVSINFAPQNTAARNPMGDGIGGAISNLVTSATGKIGGAIVNELGAGLKRVTSNRR